MGDGRWEMEDGRWKMAGRQSVETSTFHACVRWNPPFMLRGSLSHRCLSRTILTRASRVIAAGETNGLGPTYGARVPKSELRSTMEPCPVKLARFRRCRVNTLRSPEWTPNGHRNDPSPRSNTVSYTVDPGSIPGGGATCRAEGRRRRAESRPRDRNQVSGPAAGCSDPQ